MHKRTIGFTRGSNKKIKKFSNFKLLIVKEHECISTIESKFYEF